LGRIKSDDSPQIYRMPRSMPYLIGDHGLELPLLVCSFIGHMGCSGKTRWYRLAVHTLARNTLWHPIRGKTS